jgi:hypothetical protein
LGFEAQPNLQGEIPLVLTKENWWQYVISVEDLENNLNTNSSVKYNFFSEIKNKKTRDLLRKNTTVKLAASLMADNGLINTELLVADTSIWHDGIIKADTTPINSFNNGISQIGVSQRVNTNNSISQVSISKIGVEQIDFTQVGIPQNSTSQIGSNHVDVRFSTSQIGIGQIGITQTTPIQVSTSQIGSTQISSDQAKGFQPSLSQVGSTQIASSEIGDLSGQIGESPLRTALRTGHETFALIRLKPYFKLENLDLECTCL